MDTPTTITLGFGAIAVILSINSTFQTRRSANDRIKILEEYEKYKRENERRFTILETNWVLFTRVIEKDLGSMLHSPHRKDLDELIEKNERDELSREEALQFAKILDETLSDAQLRPGEEVGIKLYKASIVSRFRLWELIA